MAVSFSILILSIMGLVTASTYTASENIEQSSIYYPLNTNCTEYTIPITITTTDSVFNFTRWTDNFSLEQTLIDLTSRNAVPFISGTKNTTASYEIAASFCTPKIPGGEGKEKKVILATHGIGLGREHWTSGYKPEQYNFVQRAIEEGYSVFLYDRLGCGRSSKLSGFESQLSQPVAVLKELASFVSNGQYTGAIGKPSGLALVGFSFGSFITHTAIAATPDLADAVVLTAIGLNTTGINGNGLLRSFVPRVAAEVDIERFGQLDEGYLTWADEYAYVENYMQYPNYEHGALTYNQQFRQAFSIGEFLTFASTPDGGEFTGSALAITAENDYIVCDGYCPDIYDEPATTIYRNAKKFEKYLAPGTNHNLNFHYSTPQSYNIILEFLDKNLN